MISAAFFGIYHGNVLQAVYAFVLGGIFAWFLEMGGNKWTSVLMHIGANTWILIFSEYAQTLVEKAGAGSLLMIYGVFAATMIGGYQYFARRGRKTWLPGCLTNVDHEYPACYWSSRVIDEYLLLQRICSGIIV